MPTVRDLLTFENQHPRHTSRKEALIVDELGLKPARYYQLLRHAIRTEEAWAIDPLLCGRLLERERRAAA